VFTYATEQTMPVFQSTQQSPGAPGYPERSGQTVKIVKEYGDDEIDRAEVGPMFRIQFEDGLETDAFADELTDPIEQLIERLDDAYKLNEAASLLYPDWEDDYIHAVADKGEDYSIHDYAADIIRDNTACPECSDCAVNIAKLESLLIVDGRPCRRGLSGQAWGRRRSRQS
jgi:hypothetical protein